jgi:large subunit ribosomal protein L10
VLTRAQKEEQVTQLRDKFGRATSVYLADYRGVTVEQINRLRSQLVKEGAGEYEYHVLKNTVLRRAVADSRLEGISGYLSGPTSVAISFGDPVRLAKTLVDYAKQHEVFELKGGFLEGKALDSREIATLATLPTLEELRGQLVGLLQAPATKLVRLLAEPGGQLARLVQARSSAMAGESGA